MLVACMSRQMLPSCTRQKESMRMATEMQPMVTTRAARLLDVAPSDQHHPSATGKIQCQATRCTAALRRSIVNPTNILVNEHRIIEQVLDCLERMVDRCASQAKLDEAKQQVLGERLQRDDSENRCGGSHEEYVAIANRLADHFGVPRAQLIED